MVKRAAVVPTSKAPHYMSYNLSHYIIQQTKFFANCYQNTVDSRFQSLLRIVDAHAIGAAQYPLRNGMRFVVPPHRLVNVLPDLTALLTLAGLEWHNTRGKFGTLLQENRNLAYGKGS
jgi:hypothetical protein